MIDWAGSYGGMGPAPEHVVAEHDAEAFFINGGFHKVKSFRGGPHPVSYTHLDVYKRQPPYSAAELQSLAEHCTAQEDAAQKVERRMRKSEAAMLLESHVGQQYDAIVTGSSESGHWVRIFAPPAEGRLASSSRGLEVGQRVRVKLMSTDVARGFIDFAVVH